MKQQTINSLKKSTIIVIVLLCIVQRLKAQTDSIPDRPQFLLYEFETGILKLKTGGSIPAVMNYNTVTEKVTFYQNGTFRDLNKPETVDTIFLHNMKFVLFGNVFYEILADGKVTLFVQHKSNLTSTGRPAALGTTTQTLGTSSYSKYNSYNNSYDLKLPENFKVTPSPLYWVRINNIMHRIISQSQFLKIFPGQKDALREFIVLNDINIRDQDDLIKIIKYCNELIR